MPLQRSRATNAPLPCIAATLLWLVPALASASEPILVAPTVAGGELGPAARARLEARLGDAIAKSDLIVVETNAQGGDTAGACRDEACRAAVLREHNARFLLVPSIAVEDQDYTLRLTLYGPRGQQVATLEEVCGLCGLAEAEDVFADLGARVGRKIEVASRASVLTLTSEPGGARVYVGDELVGTTPVELPLEAGAHPLRVELDGHISQQRAVDVVAGEHQSLAFQLQPVPVDAAAQRRKAKILSGAGFTSLGLGLGMVAGGAALIALDERPIKSDCTGDNIDAEGNCRFRHATLEGGIAVAIGGAVLVGTAAALLAVAHKKKKSNPPHTSHASRVRPRAGGLSVSF